jgi:hypothetical protein
MIRLLKEPLLQFFALGAVLFGVFGLAGTRDANAPAKIAVSTGRIENLADSFARTWQRPPTLDELRGLIEDYIRDEVFYREAVVAGLDRDDVVIRRRLRQKMEFFAQDIGVAEPSDEQLTAYLATHAEKFRSEDRLTFRHIFLNAGHRPRSLQGDAEAVAVELARTSADIDVTTLGDHFLLGEEFRAMPVSDIARTFGDGFAERVSGLDQGRWHGPISSSYGLHFVFVSEHAAGGPLPLDTVRPDVRREWLNERRVDAEHKLYRTLREHYEIVMEALPAVRTKMNEPVGAVR